MKEYSSAMKGEENHDLTLQWNIVYVILNILSPWYMLLDDLFLKNKRKKKKGKIEKKKKKDSSTAGVGPMGCLELG